MAHIEFKLDNKNLQIVSKVIIDHNHILTSLDKAYILRSHHKMLPIHMMIIDQMENAGVNPSQGYKFFLKDPKVSNMSSL